MDKILSARVDEAVLLRLNMLAKTMNTTKKKVIEKAILHYSEKIAKDRKVDVLERTLGSWNREEFPDETVRRIRKKFKESQERYKR